jgi:hypothetical protein
MVSFREIIKQNPCQFLGIAILLPRNKLTEEKALRHLLWNCNPDCRGRVSYCISFLRIELWSVTSVAGKTRVAASGLRALTTKKRFGLANLLSTGKIKRFVYCGLSIE